MAAVTADQIWVEMEDLARRPLNRSSWIFLRQLERIRREGTYAFPGFIEEFHGVATAMFPALSADQLAQIEYQHVNSAWPHRPFLQDGEYCRAGTILPDGDTPGGSYLVLEQRIEGAGRPEDWHLDQDLTLGLELMRNGDQWTAPGEDGVVVAELSRDSEGKPNSLRMRAEFLRDFLAARGQGLLITSYMSRTAVVESIENLTWKDANPRRAVEAGAWEGFVQPIHTSGLPYGEKIHVVRAFRTDTDDIGDAPSVDMFDNKVESEQYDVAHRTPQVYRVSGELRRTEWFEPGERSVRVRGDKEPTEGIEYKVEADGRTLRPDALQKGPVRWLYFEPEVIRSLADRPTTSFSWYTQETGGLWLRGYSLHFGITGNGLVNVVASDVAELPATLQRTWVAHNVTPNGPVSDELLAAQMRVQPADTVAAEDRLIPAIDNLNSAWLDSFGSPLLREVGDISAEIRASCHRFRALQDSEMPTLAKNLFRYVVERFDEQSLSKLAPTWTGTGPDTRRSLTKIRDVLASHGIETDAIRQLQALNSVRQADSHLASSTWAEALTTLNVDPDAPYPHKSRQLIAAVVSALDQLTEAVKSIT